MIDTRLDIRWTRSVQHTFLLKDSVSMYWMLCLMSIPAASASVYSHLLHPCN